MTWPLSPHYSSAILRYWIVLFCAQRLIWFKDNTEASIRSSNSLTWSVYKTDLWLFSYLDGSWFFFTLPLEMESRSKPSLRMGLRKDFLLIYMQSTDRYIIHFMMPRPFSLSLSISHSPTHNVSRTNTHTNVDTGAHKHARTHSSSHSEGTCLLSLCRFLCLYFSLPLAWLDPMFFSPSFPLSLYLCPWVWMSLFIPFSVCISLLQCFNPM